MKTVRFLIFTLLLFSEVSTGSNKAEVIDLTLMSQVRAEQRLGNQLSLNSYFMNQLGEPVSLSTYFNQKPVVLTFVYYQCPNLCSLTLNGLIAAMSESKKKLGEDYVAVTISINSREKPALALAKQRTYLTKYLANYHNKYQFGYNEKNASEFETKWSFLTGTALEIARITESAGFHFEFDPLSQQYSHPSEVIIATPTGKISQHFMGIQFSAEDFGAAVERASRQEMGTLVENILLYCLHYDPGASAQGKLIIQLIRITGTISVGMLAYYLFYSFRKEKEAS